MSFFVSFAHLTSISFAHLLTYALSLPVYHRPQTILSCAAVSIFLQLNLKPAVHISISRSLFQVFLGRPLPLWPCGIHRSTCLGMLSSLRLSVCPIQFNFLHRCCSVTGCSFVFFNSSMLVILFGQCTRIYRIHLRHLLMDTWILCIVVSVV